LLAVATPVRDGLEIIVASAGHPLPIVRHPDGTVSTVGEPGALLGIWEQSERHETRFILRHGELMVAYSDGATDHRGPDGTFGEERLLAAVQTAGTRPQDTLTAIREALVMFNDSPPSDDIAIIALAPRIEAYARLGGPASSPTSEDPRSSAPPLDDDDHPALRLRRC
jgi:serine phosphatase RsbU (regulator of sigma subunit)